MEKLAQSKFGKFEGSLVHDLKVVRGGDYCTGGGASTQGTVVSGGTTYYIVSEYDSDSTSNSGATTYYGYRTSWYKAHEL